MDTIVPDVISFIVDRKRLRNDLHRDHTMKLTEVVALLFHIWRCTGRDPHGVNVRHFTNTVHGDLCARVSFTVGEVRQYDPATRLVHITLLPSLLEAYTSQELSDAGMEEILNSTVTRVGVRRYTRPSVVVAPEEAPASSSMAPLMNEAPLTIAPYVPNEPYAGWSREDLVVLACRRHEDFSDLQGEVKQLQSKAGYWRRKSEALDDKLKRSDEEHKALMHMVDFRPARNVSAYGGYSMALCRSLSHCGAAAIVKMLGSGAIAGDLRWKGTV